MDCKINKILTYLLHCDIIHNIGILNTLPSHVGTSMQKISKNRLMLCLRKAKPLWNKFLLVLILVYNLAAPAQSLVGFTPTAAGSPLFKNGTDAERVNTPSAYPAMAACSNASCVYLPWLVSPVPARIVEVNISGTRIHTYRIIGDATVIYEYPVYNLTVKLQAFDSAGQLIDEFTGPTAFPATLPGQLNPFDIVTDIDYTQVARVEVVIAGFDLNYPFVYAPATVITTTEGSTVYALIRNDGPSPLTDVQAVAWSLFQYFNYPNQGLEKVADTLLPGETVTYTKTFS